MIAALRGRARLARRLAAMEWSTNGGRPRPAMLRAGLLSSRSWLYPVAEWPPACFLSDVAVEGPLSIANPIAWRRLLADKLAVHAIAVRAAQHIPMPVLRGLCVSGRDMVLDGRAAERPVIAKPLDGSGGRDIRRLGPGDPLPGRGTYLLEAPVAPHPYSAAIFPGALNTIRVVIGRRVPGAAPMILGAAHRFGTAASAPADNFKKGGVVAHVDTASGTLSGALVRGVPGDRRIAVSHPETGARIAGVVVPFWPEACALALRVSDAFPMLVYLGADIAIAPDGPVLIELNTALPNPNLIQFHRPLLADPEARAFFRAIGVISEARARAAAQASPAA